MSHPEHDPRNVAARYRVQSLGDGGFELRAAQGTLPSLNVRRRGAFLNLKTAPQAAHWYASERSNAFHLVRLRVEELAIGNRGDEGWSSPLVDNCFFVIDGEKLRYVPLTELRILSEEQFLIEKDMLARTRGEEVIVETKPDENQDRPLAMANIIHCSAMPEHDVAETLECTVGLPSEYFQNLLDGCLNRRISKVYLRGIGGALSSSFEYGSTRELILCANEGFDIKISDVSFDYLV